MFNYLFPIFCFGLVMTGIVLLGILEAFRQVKAEDAREREAQTRESDPELTPFRNSHSPRFTARSVNE